MYHKLNAMDLLEGRRRRWGINRCRRRIMDIKDGVARLFFKNTVVREFRPSYHVIVSSSHSKSERRMRFLGRPSSY